MGERQFWAWLVRGARGVVPVVLAVLGASLMQDAPRVSGAQSASLADGMYAKSQASRGEDLYYRACSTCHGPTLAGSEMGPPLEGDEFLDGWDGEVLSELMLFIQERMPEDAPGELEEGQTRDLLAYLLAANGFPPGHELTRSSMDTLVIERPD